MFNKIERTNKKKKKQKTTHNLPKHFVYTYIYVWIQYILHRFSCLDTMMCIFYIFVHIAKQQARKATKWKTYERRRKRKKIRQKRIKLILRVYFLHYALLMEVWFNIHIDGWIQWNKKNIHTISFGAVFLFVLFFLSPSHTLTHSFTHSLFNILLEHFISATFVLNALGRLLVLFAIITIRKNIHMFFFLLLLSLWCCCRLNIA